VEQLQGLNLATPVLDVHMPYVVNLEEGLS
jgi:hypothetical protein